MFLKEKQQNKWKLDNEFFGSKITNDITHLPVASAQTQLFKT